MRDEGLKLVQKAVALDDSLTYLTADGFTFRKMAVKMISPVAAFTSGKIKLQGSWLGFLIWFGRFDRN